MTQIALYSNFSYFCGAINMSTCAYNFMLEVLVAKFLEEKNS